MFSLVRYVFDLLFTIFFKKTLTNSCLSMGSQNGIDALRSVADTYLNAFI